MGEWRVVFLRPARKAIYKSPEYGGPDGGGQTHSELIFHNWSFAAPSEDRLATDDWMIVDPVLAIFINPVAVGCLVMQ